MPPDTNGRVYRFGPFEADFEAAELRKHGIRLRVQDQPLNVLSALIERPGEMVSREVLQARLWPADTFVDFEKGLNTSVARLRQALGDSADQPRYVETHAKRGYRFIAPVTTVERGRAVPGAAANEYAPPAPVIPSARGWRRLWAVPAVVLACASIAAVMRVNRDQRPTALVQLTHDLGLSTDPALSPDGKLLAYASDRGGDGRLNIWVQQLVPGGKRIQLSRLELGARQPAFSPDGSKIVFSSEAGAGLYVVPSIGGETVRLAPAGSGAHYSPDGQWIAFDDANYSHSATGVFLMSSSGGPARQLGPSQSCCPIWAPDSKRLLITRLNHEPELEDWWIAPLDGGPPQKTGAYEAMRARGLSAELGLEPKPAAWFGDSIIFDAEFSGTRNIWTLPLAAGGNLASRTLKRLTSGTLAEVAPSVAPDHGFVFAGIAAINGIWSVPMQANQGIVTGRLAKLNQSTADEFTPALNLDGAHVAYTVRHESGLDILHKNLTTGEEATLVASSAPKWHPILSREGDWVAFTDRGPNRGVYVVPASGGPSTRVADGTSYVWDWSAGGRGLLYLKDHSSGDIHLLDLASKRTTLFLHRGGASLFQAKYSPDYRWLSVAAIRPGMECEILIVPLHDGVPAARSEWVPVVNENVWTDKPRWSPDGNLLYFLSQRDGFLCIWAQRLESSTKRPVGAPKPVYHLHDTRLSLKNVPIASVELEVARDRLLINLGETTGNIWKSSDESITAAR